MNGQAPLKIVIVGAGLGGLAVAVAARLQGVEVVVLEAASKLGEVSVLFLSESFCHMTLMHAIRSAREYNCPPT